MGPGCLQAQAWVVPGLMMMQYFRKHREKRKMKPPAETIQGFGHLHVHTTAGSLPLVPASRVARSHYAFPLLGAWTKKG